MKHISRHQKEIIALFFFLIFVTIFCVILYIKNDSVKTIEISKNIIVDKQLQYFLDVNENNEEYYIIRGWCYKPKENIEFSNNTMILKNIKTQKYYKLVTKFEQREDVTKNINDGFNYTNSGFYSRVRCSKFPKGEKYKLCFLYQSSNNNFFQETDEIIIPNP